MRAIVHLPHRLRALRPGDHLFRQGDPTGGLYRVASGAVRLERRTFDGRLLVVQQARAGELIAEASLFAAAYHCDAVATEDSSVEAYDRAVVLASLRDDPGVGQALLAHMARQLQAARQRLELRDVRPATERVLLHLDLQADETGTVRFAGPLQDLAAEIGLTREAYYRALARLARQGLVRREDGLIRLMQGRI